MTDIEQTPQTPQDKVWRGGSGPKKEHAKEPFIEAFRNSGTILSACRAVGINRTTVATWRENDPVFAQKFIEADLSVTEALERTALTVALDRTNRAQATMLIFLLKSRFPEKYRERITHDVNVKFMRSVITEVASVVRKHVPIELSNTISKELEVLSARLGGDESAS